MSPYRPDLVATWLFRLDRRSRPEILLLHRGPDRLFPGIWQCVTGRLEPGERILDGALREVEEETGVGRSDLETVYETDMVNWFHEDSSDALWCEAVFAAQVRHEVEIRLSNEHDDLRWVSPGEAHQLVVWPAYQRAIDMVLWLVDNPEKAATYRLLNSEA